MENPALITRVVLENYKSIAFCDVRLNPLAILVGPNGSGKSNFLDALLFLSETMSGPIENAFEKRGRFSSVLRRGAGVNNYLGFRIEFVANEAKGFYSVRFRKDEATDAGYVVERERCVIESPNALAHYDAVGATLLDSTQPNVPAPTPGYFYLLIMAAYPDFSPPFQLINNWRRYNFSPKDFRQPIPSGGADLVLTSDGANLSNVLNHFELRYRTAFDRIIQYLRAINPSLKSVETVEVRGYRTLEFLLYEIDGSFSPLQMSDGTMRSLAVLVALFQKGAGALATSLVMLEEPEIALHPAAAGVLFDAMREASASVQVIATTHSADLLDKKEIETDAILSVELDKGITRIGHVDATGRKALKEQLYTAGELMRMNYLRPESSRTPSELEMESMLFGDLVPV